MDFKLFNIQKILLILFVFAVSLGIGWYGEKAIEKFIVSGKVQTL